MSVRKVQRKLTVSMTGTSTKRQGTKGPWEGQMCVQRAEVLKRGAAALPLGASRCI